MCLDRDHLLGDNLCPIILGIYNIHFKKHSMSSINQLKNKSDTSTAKMKSQETLELETKSFLKFCYK